MNHWLSRSGLSLSVSLLVSQPVNPLPGWSTGQQLHIHATHFVCSDAYYHHNPCSESPTRPPLHAEVRPAEGSASPTSYLHLVRAPRCRPTPHLPSQPRSTTRPSLSTLPINFLRFIPRPALSLQIPASANERVAVPAASAKLPKQPPSHATTRPASPSTSNQSAFASRMRMLLLNP